jgi:hypothetical protein
MKAKTTQKTPRTGETKITNRELLSKMIHLSNNSILTQRAANMLSQKLDVSEMKQLIEWIWHADSQMKSNQQTTRRRYPY